MVAKFGTRDDIYNISDKFAGQGHRSKIKVTGSKKLHFQDFFDLSEQISSLGLWCDVMTSWDHVVTL